MTVLIEINIERETIHDLDTFLSHTMLHEYLRVKRHIGLIKAPAFWCFNKWCIKGDTHIW